MTTSARLNNIGKRHDDYQRSVRKNRGPNVLEVFVVRILEQLVAYLHPTPAFRKHVAQSRVAIDPKSAINSGRGIETFSNWSDALSTIGKGTD